VHLNVSHLPLLVPRFKGSGWKNFFVLNRDDGISVSKSGGTRKISHSFDGDEAPPGKRQALPTRAIGSSENAISITVNLNEQLVSQAAGSKGADSGWKGFP
jgi:hypothetical protein